MSRGLGSIQKKLLAVLERHSGALDTFDLAAKAYALKPGKGGTTWLTDAQLVSVRRALRGLAKAKKIYPLGRGKRLLWANERFGLWWTIRRMQQLSQVIAHNGDARAFKAHADKMLPLLERAGVRGIDLGETPPRPAGQRKGKRKKRR